MTIFIYPAALGDPSDVIQAASLPACGLSRRRNLLSLRPSCGARRAVSSIQALREREDQLFESFLAVIPAGRSRPRSSFEATLKNTVPAATTNAQATIAG